MRAIEHELELTNRALLAAENWAATYAKAPKQHAAMIKLGAKLQRLVLTYLRDLAKTVPSTIDWYAYARAVLEQQRSLKADANVLAYDVNVIINQDAADAQDQAFIKIVFDTVAAIITEGVNSMAEEFDAPIGLTTSGAIIQDLTTEQLANLVGMRLDKTTGLITPNPNPAYNIDETTRSRIANSIKTSIRLGENQQQAAARLESIIADSARADMIAYTETVRAYAEGRRAYAYQSNAVAKHNYDSNAIDICADNTAQGWIPINEDFVSGDQNEPFHVHCQCQVLYSYDLGDLA